jgi:hypothetical protein
MVRYGNGKEWERSKKISSGAFDMDKELDEFHQIQCQKNKKECTHEAMTSASLFANPFNVGQISSISVNHLRPPYSLRFARPSRTTI